jgi:hypothetical protein
VVEKIGATRRLGFWSAFICAVLSVTYVLGQLFEWQGLLGSAGGPSSVSTPAGIAILLTPSLLLGSAFLIMMSALHRASSADRKVFGQVALSFAIVYATLISLVYFAQLTFVGPRIAAGDTSGIELLLFVPYKSFLFAVDLLGYSMMSVSTLFGAFALPPVKAARTARLFMLLNGALLPFLALQMFFPDLIYVAALWAVTFPCAALWVAGVFRRIPSDAHGQNTGAATVIELGQASKPSAA